MKSTILTADKEKQALISRLSDQKIPLMFFYDEPPDERLSHEKVDSFITLVQPPYNYKTLSEWLYLGNWQAIFPANKDYQPFNTFKTKQPDIEQRMRAAGITLLIDSFHDDIEWYVIEVIQAAVNSDFNSGI